MGRGVLIDFEGIDGTGKGTQARLLTQAMRRTGRTVRLFSFPAYGRTLSSKLIGAYLNGDLGQLDARVAAMLFACDRLEQAPMLRDSLASGEFVICDRYVPSNLAHQVARAAPGNRDALRRFILDLEFKRFSLPKPDAVVFLDMVPALARRRVLQKGRRSYTNRSLDVQEASTGHLQGALSEYRLQARGPRWIRIATIDGEGTPRTRGDIHFEIMQKLAKKGLIPRIAARPTRTPR